jgi:hypothetical protein
VNPFAALRTGFEFEAVGVKDTGAPPAGIGRWPSGREDVFTAVAMLSRHQPSLARVGRGDGDTKINVVATRDLVRVCQVRRPQEVMEVFGHQNIADNPGSPVPRTSRPA